MVALRDTHEASFDFEPWAAKLNLPDEHKEKLSHCHLYAVNCINAYNAKISQGANNNAKPRAALLDPKNLTNLSAEIISILMTLNMDLDSLMVAFLYPPFEAKALDLDKLEEDFGSGIRKLLLKVKDMEAIRFLQNYNANKGAEAQVDRVRRMMLSMVDDVRAVVIKLAERIAVIRAAKYADEETKLAIAREIANIYAPLANR